MPARIMKQHKSEESSCFRRRFRTHQRPYQPTKTDCFGAKISPEQWLPSSCRITFVEDEVDDGEYCVEPRRHIACIGHFVGNECVANLPLRPDQPLRHRRWR